MNGKELAAALGYSDEWLSRLKRKDPAFVRRFEVTQPVGQRRYARALVEQYLAGRSLVAIGAGSRTMRRTA